MHNPDFILSIKNDYHLAVLSRECSLLGRKEVLTGKAKFGIFGDGKELAQIAWAKVFRNGDFRSGYYRDQTFMMAIKELSAKSFFASLYADTDLKNEPSSGGRQMNGHFSTPTIDKNGEWLNLMLKKNSSSDVSPTGAQMPRLLGLAQASKIYKEFKLKNQFTNNGNEIAWGTIGNAATSEGIFWETMNAAGVMQIPMVICVWDDDYGISVHSKHQTIKQNISKALSGFQRKKSKNGKKWETGFEIINARGWNYAELVSSFEKAEVIARNQHVPVLLHVTEMTQPQGHSTSGSHERYKSKERLQWENEFDCLRQFRLFIEEHNLIGKEELNKIELGAKDEAKSSMKEAYKNYLEPLANIRDQAANWLDELGFAKERDALRNDKFALWRDSLSLVRLSAIQAQKKGKDVLAARNWINYQLEKGDEAYSRYLHSNSALDIEIVNPTYSNDSDNIDGRIILRDNFNAILEKFKEVIIFGEDVGTIGDVNQGLEGMQAIHGENRIFDTGIREATIAGQGIGLAMRGLRPIAEIQYLDYLLYALQILSDDCATVHWRTKGTQKAPLIVRTRGHRLEGVWHSGSPMGLILNSLRGMYICVPRNMTKAAGMYNTLLRADEPALVIECLNGYRLKEKPPTNIGEFTVELGKIEFLRQGSQITVVTYGSMCRIVEDASVFLESIEVDIEVIDCQTLLPFDLNHDILKSLKKTNRLLIVDEDMEGGASAFILKRIIEDQNGYNYLDAAPVTLTSKSHRPAYGSDGDYFSKPSFEDVVEAVLELFGK